MLYLNIHQFESTDKVLSEIVAIFLFQSINCSFSTVNDVMSSKLFLTFIYANQVNFAETPCTWHYLVWAVVILTKERWWLNQDSSYKRISGKLCLLTCFWPHHAKFQILLWTWSNWKLQFCFGLNSSFVRKWQLLNNCRPNICLSRCCLNTFQFPGTSNTLQ